MAFGNNEGVAICRWLDVEKGEGEVVFDYPFLGGPFRNLVYCDWLSWHGDAGDSSEGVP